MRGFSRITLVLFCTILTGAVVSPLRAQTTSQPVATAPTQAEIAARETTANEIRRQKVTALVADARKLYEATQFREAADLLRQATIIDPRDENAALMLRVVSDKIITQEYESIRNRTAQMGSGGISRPVVPQAFDPNAMAITFKATAAAPAVSDATTKELLQDIAANRAARDKLEVNLKELTAENQPLDKVLIFLRDSMANQILVNWAALHDAGIEKSSPVTVSLKQVPYRKALSTVLAQVGGATANLAYTLDAGNIVISTKADLGYSSAQVDKTYDVRDFRDMLVAAVIPTTTPATSPATATDPGKLRQEILTNIIDTILTSVAPDTWKDAGGKIGTIREENGLLIIHQTLDNQLAIHNLLQQLREERSIQIACEARVLIVSPNFLNNFRIGWNAGPATAPAQAAVATAPKPDADVHATIIDNWTLNLLLTATQADKNTLTFTAPRLTVSNAGEGRLECPMPQRYITGYSAKPVPIEAAPIGPDYATTDTGIRVTLQPTVSADRRYIVTRLNLNSRILTALDHAPATPPNLPANANLFIDKPTIKAATDTFTLAIPDGGTLLLDAGPVPPNFPADSPDLKNPRRMLILIRPNIIIHRDIENDLFGVGYDRPNGLPTATAPFSPTTPKP